MKNEIRLALMCLAAASAPAFAQSNSPMCGTTNLDKIQNIYTVRNPQAAAVNEQCFIIVYQNGAVPAEASQHPGSYFVEGKYTIDLVGGGGGGGGGGAHMQGGGGGGAGAAPLRTVQTLAPGVYKMTIGTGGEGGSAQGGATGAGNPTSLTNAYTGQLIAGFAGADTWNPQYQGAGSGRGGVGKPGGSTGGSGADATLAGGGKSEQPAQAGGASATGGYAGVAGEAGRESERSAEADKKANIPVQADAGGGGGASIGSGATGGSERVNAAAEAGGRGGPGLIKLSLLEATPPVVVATTAAAVVPTMTRYSLSTDTLFGFNKYSLRPEGEAKLDELVGKLKSVNIDSITDTGHADRIGSNEANQKLSVQRAEAVKAYLVGRGIPANQIVATGKGETQPVTAADDCKGAKSEKVIACLQPDRRVDIDVLGTNKMVGLN